MNLLTRLAYHLRLFGYIGMRLIITPPEIYRRDLAQRREKLYRSQKAKRLKKQPQRRGVRGK